MSVTPARGRQLSLFGVEARPPTPSDLEGLLAGAGEVGRMGGTGKVSIVVEDAWRAAALKAECEHRGLVVACEPVGVQDRWTVRTAYAAVLAPLAARWLPGGAKVCPRDLVLDGRRLRLWVTAAGSWDGQRAYLLRLAPSPIPVEEPPEPDGDEDDGAQVEAQPEPEPTTEPSAPAPVVKKVSTTTVPAEEVDEWLDDVRDWPDDLPTVVLDPLTVPVETEQPIEPDEFREPGEPDETDGIDRQIADNWVAVGDALAAAGLIAVFVGPKAGGPAYRIVGLRRVTRLAELIGEPPVQAPAGTWPR